MNMKYSQQETQTNQYIASETLSTDKIVLKQSFIHPVARMVRINSFKAAMRDDELQIFVDNGKSKDGRKNRAGIRLNQYQMKQLVNMLQLNIK